jgi:hypothetical protein
MPVLRDINLRLRISALREQYGMTAALPLPPRIAAPWGAPMGCGFRKGCAVELLLGVLSSIISHLSVDLGTRCSTYRWREAHEIHAADLC